MLRRMGFKVKGTLHVINETQQVSARFTKREFVLHIADGRFPQHVQFQLTGERVGNIDAYNVGDEVEVEFNLRGREWTSPKGEVRFFNSLDVWTIDRVGASAQGGAPDLPPPPDDPPPTFDDDIPF
ncbi:MAG: DUF3127 domain-containing protein [Nannocystaceae bacterium]|nr:DUF3127 domain-containing protein [Nannocystaceae bacterium]